MTIPNKRQGLLFVLIGPAGTGKNTLMNGVLSRVADLHQLPTATTRPIRPAEVQGREHLFVDVAEFERMDRDGELIERQRVHGQHYYGVPKSTVENAIAANRDLIADIDILGASYLRSLYPDNTVLIFIKPPSIDALEERLRIRGENEQEIARRMHRVGLEIAYAPLCDYLIINDNMARATELLYGIVLAERSRRDLLNLRVDAVLPRHPFIYSGGVVPVFSEEVLGPDKSPYFITAQIAHGELPHEAALRVLATKLNIFTKPDRLINNQSDSEFISPISVESIGHPGYREVSFVYLYSLPERIAAPDGWQWQPVENCELPPAVKDTLSEFSQMRSAE